MKCLSCVKTISSILLISFAVITLTATLAAAVKPDCEKVVICHKPTSTTIILEVEAGVNGNDLCVDDNAINNHLDHGDVLGACVTSPAN